MTSHVVSTVVQGGSFRDAINTMDWGDVGISAVQGGLVASGVGAIAAGVGGAILRSGIDVTSDGVSIVGVNKPLVEVGKDLVGEAIGMGAGKILPFDRMAGNAVSKAFVRDGFKSSGHFLAGYAFSELASELVGGVTSGLIGGGYNYAFERYFPEERRARPVQLPGVRVVYDTQTGTTTVEEQKKVFDHIRRHGHKSWMNKFK